MLQDKWHMLSAGVNVNDNFGLYIKKSKDHATRARPLLTEVNLPYLHNRVKHVKPAQAISTKLLMI